MSVYNEDKNPMLVFTNGMRARILFDMIDQDELGEDRVTVSGSIGRLEASVSDLTWSVIFENGAAGFFTEAELLDSSQCEILAPSGGA